MNKIIARDNQLEQLEALLQETVQGKLHLALITGEPGVGKTALARQFIKTAQGEHPDLFVAQSKCESIAGGQQESYLPFIQIIGQLSTAKKEGSGRLRRAMAEVAPDWIAAIPGVGAMVSAAIKTLQWGNREIGSRSGELDLNHRMIQYTNALCLASETAPLLLFIDDLHWSDSATLNLISFIADHAKDHRILLLLTCRPTDIACGPEGQLHPVRHLTCKLHRYQQTVELALSNFNLEELQEFLIKNNCNFSKRFIDYLLRQSGGNPLFVEEYLKLLQERHLSSGHDSMFLPENEEADIPLLVTLKEIVEQRLEIAGHELQRLLIHASVQGEYFSSKILSQQLETSENNVLEHLNSLERTYRLIREQRGSHPCAALGGKYQFAHALIQQMLYSNLGSGQRRLLHLSVGELLEIVYGDGATEYAADLAIHFECGRDFPKAVLYNLQAGHNALSAFSPDDTQIRAEKVRELSKKIEDQDLATRWHLEALLQITEACYQQFQYDKALANCSKGESLSVQHSDDEIYARFLYWRHRVFYVTRKFEESAQTLRKAIEILKRKPDNSELFAHLYAELGDGSRISSKVTLEEINSALHNAITLAEKYGFEKIKERALIHKAWTAINRENDYLAGLQFAQQALAVAQRNNMQTEEIGCHRVIGYALRLLGEDNKSLSHTQAAIKIAQRHGRQRSMHFLLYSLAISIASFKRDLRQSLTIIKKSRNISEKYEFPADRGVLGRWFSFSLALGEWHEAKRATRLYKDSIDLPSRTAWIEYHRLRGQFYFAKGLLRKSIDAYQTSLKEITEPVELLKNSRALTQLYLGFALFENNDILQSKEFLQDAFTHYQQKKKAYNLSLCLIGLARISVIQKEYKQAGKYLQKAIKKTKEKGFERGGFFSSYWVICNEFAKLLLHQGNFEKGIEYAFVGYRRCKKAGHFLLGENSFTVGKLLCAQNNHKEAVSYLEEARSEWQRLELNHSLKKLDAFFQKIL